MKTAFTLLVASMSVLTTQLLIGCYGSYVVHESEARSELAQQAEQIEVGQTSRAAVRSALGVPPWSNDELGFDAWRIADRQWNVVYFLDGGFPTWKNHFAYVLVTYDEHEIVSGFDVESSPKGYRTLIEADGLLIESEWDEAAAQVGLLGPRRDAYLEQMRHTPDCLGLLGAEPGWNALRLSIDGRPVDVGDSTFSQNDIATIPASWLVLVRLTPGEHRVEARELGNDSIHPTSIRCASGEPVYLAARTETAIAEVTGMFGVRSQRVQSIGVKFEPSPIMPTDFVTRPLMVYSAGRWLAR